MRKLYLIGIFAFSILGCSEESIVKSQDINIDRLELTVIKPNENYNLRTIYFIDNNTGFAGGYDSKLIKTADGGESWTELETNTEANFFGIDFIDKNNGFVVGGSGDCVEIGCVPFSDVMLRTKDGGITWERVSLNLSEKTELHSVHFVNNSIGFAIGNSLIIRTIDGGNSWEEKRIDNLGGIMQNIDFNGTRNGMIISTGGKIVSTTDGGNTWVINSEISVVGSVSISLASDNIAFASGNTKIFKSNNFGSSWIELANSPTDNFDINFVTKDLGFAVGRGNFSGGDFGHFYGAIAYTTDGGENWVGNKNIIETGSFLESSFPSEKVGYIVSSNKILKIIIN